MARSKSLDILLFVLVLLCLVLSIQLFLDRYFKKDAIVTVAGVLRCVDDKGWFAIDDESHEPVNIHKVFTKKGKIVIAFPFTASKIHTFVAVPDETFSQEGFTIGASVSRQYAVLTVSKLKNGKMVPVDAGRIRSQYGNFWVHGIFSVGKQDNE